MELKKQIYFLNRYKMMIFTESEQNLMNCMGLQELNEIRGEENGVILFDVL